MGVTEVDFVGPKNAPFTNIVGHLQLPTPVTTDDIATKTYVDGVASSITGTEGTFSYSFTGTSSGDPEVLSMHFTKMGKVVVLSNTAIILFTGNDTPITAVDTTPVAVRPTGDVYPMFYLPCYDNGSDSLVTALLRFQSGNVSMYINGFQAFDAGISYSIPHFSIYYTLE